jgi:CO/xanthine dehydrogenase FAD-binding subunit
MSYRLVRPEALIDLNRCPGLDYIRRDESRLIVGPMTRQAAAEHSDIVRNCCPLITKAMIYLGTPTIRNRGTMGGTLAHADRTAELPAVAVALEAEVVAQGPNGLRRIPAEDFFLGDLTTDLQTDEMLREINFPVSSETSACAFVETGNRRHDLALAGIAVYLVFNESNVISKARVSCNGIGPRPVRFKSVENNLCGTRADADAIRHAAKLCLDGIEPEGDIHATAEYRSAILPGLVARALEQAVRERF